MTKTWEFASFPLLSSSFHWAVIARWSLRPCLMLSSARFRDNRFRTTSAQRSLALDCDTMLRRPISIISEFLRLESAAGIAIIGAAVLALLLVNSPAATDIAFALGVIAILGNRVPASLKVFLTALAIIDDLGAIAIVALFYTADLSGFALGLAGAAWAVLLAFNLLGVRRLTPHLLVGLVLWGAVLASGIHATLAGIAVALLIPLRGPGAAQEDSPLHRLERGLHPCVAYGILPLFALTNAGLSFTQVAARDLLGPLPLGIAGVLCGSWFAVKCGWAEWPTASASQIYGIAVLCGIGFTMSLFIGGLAFPSDELQNQVKLGVFAVSVLSAVIGYLVLRFAAPWSNE